MVLLKECKAAEHEPVGKLLLEHGCLCASLLLVAVKQELVVTVHVEIVDRRLGIIGGADVDDLERAAVVEVSCLPQLSRRTGMIFGNVNVEPSPPWLPLPLLALCEPRPPLCEFRFCSLAS